MTLALLDGGAREADAARELLDGERLAGQRSLVDLHGRLVVLVALLVLLQDLDVGGHDVAEAHDDDVSRNERDRVDGFDLAAAQGLGLGGECGGQGLQWV